MEESRAPSACDRSTPAAAETLGQGGELLVHGGKVELFRIVSAADPHLHLAMLGVGRIHQDSKHPLVAATSTAVLWGASSRSVEADDALVLALLDDPLDLDLVFPAIAEVVLVYELRARMGERAKGRGMLRNTENLVVNIVHAESDVPDLEVVQVTVRPSEGGLKDVVQLTQREIGGDTDPAPDGGGDTAQRDLEFESVTVECVQRFHGTMTISRNAPNVNAVQGDGPGEGCCIAEQFWPCSGSMARKERFCVPVVGRLQAKLLLEALKPHIKEPSDLSWLLSEALLALDEAGQERLKTQLGRENGNAVVKALRSVPSITAKNTPSDEPAAIEAAWAQFWKLADGIVSASNDSESCYLQNEISYTTPDLDVPSIFTDLDEAAEGLVQLVGKSSDAQVDFPSRLLRALGKIGRKLTWAIVPEEPLPLGPRLSEALLEWLRLDGQHRGLSDDDIRAAITAFAEETLPEKGNAELDAEVLHAVLAGGTTGAPKRSPRKPAKGKR